MKRYRATVIAAAVLAFLAAVLFLLALPRGASGRLIARWHDGDGTVYELPLDEDTVLEVATPLGTNTVVVEGSSVRMEAADCPHGDCLRQRPISHPGEQIICLPHELWIEIVPEDGESSGMLDEDAVSYPDDVDTVAG